MKNVFLVLAVIIIFVIILFLILRKNSGDITATGLVAGALAGCPDKANCVSSENKADARHYIEPITIPADLHIDIFSLLSEIITEMGGEVQTAEGNYLAATFTSPICKFVDDLEIRIETTGNLIHLRSASRLGYNDLGVNGQRIKELKTRFNHKIALVRQPVRYKTAQESNQL